jgi:hypothetical protein
MTRTEHLPVFATDLNGRRAFWCLNSKSYIDSLYHFPAGVLVEDQGVVIGGSARLCPSYDYHNEFGSVRVSIEGRGSPPILASKPRNR